MAYSRLTARICTVSDLQFGSFVGRSDAAPAAIVTSFGPVFRANVLATVVMAESDSRFLVEDGTGRLVVRAFTPLAVPPVGALVCLVGRPREFGGERYLVPEIVHVLDELRWALVRRLELARRVPTDLVEPPPPAEAADEADPLSQLLDTIRRLDGGSGAPTDAIVAAAGGAEAEARLRMLLAQGDVFEIRPGFVKVLE